MEGASQPFIKSRIPNYLSVFRACLGVVLLVLAFVPSPVFWGKALIILGVVSDKLDGSLARWWGVESERGKQLESIADPMFGFFATVYIFQKLDFPIEFFLVGTALFAIGNGGRIVVKLKTGKLFYEKSPISRYGVGIVYVLLFFYVLQVPYREWLLWPVLLYAGFAAGNYVRMMVRFVRREQAATGAGVKA